MAIKLAARSNRFCVTLAIALACFPTLSSADIVSDLVGLWNFDDGTGNDVSPNGNNGVVSAELSFVGDTPFASGQALSLPGAGDIRIPHAESLAFVDGTMTLAHWIKAMPDAQSGPWGGTIAKRSEPRDGGGWETQQFDMSTRMDLRFDTTTTENAVVGNLDPSYDGDWHHVAWTVDNGMGVAYLDGVRITEFEFDFGDGISNESELVIGSRDGFGTVNGFLDEVALWDIVLTDEEIALIASGPITPGLPGDFNSDDQTNSDDFDILSENFGATGDVFSLGDANLNGEVELGDFRIVKDFQGCVATGDGFTCPEGVHAAATQAPEPATMAIAVLGVVAAAAVRRRA